MTKVGGVECVSAMKEFMAEFLFEIGLEEVPARMLAGAEAELRRRVVELLTRERLLDADSHVSEARHGAPNLVPNLEARDGAPGAVESFSTPRRLAVLVRGVREAQADVTEQVMGPAAKIAYKDGKPGPAAEAFARKNGVEVSALETVDTPKGEYVAVTVTKPGRSAAAVIAAELPRELAAIHWAKNMRWMPGESTTFVRPVVWMVALLSHVSESRHGAPGVTVVPVEFGGKRAGRVSWGHRVLGSGEPFEVMGPDTWLAQLRGEFVEPVVEQRRHVIRKALDRVCRATDLEAQGLRWREDHALVDAVTHLTEWPTVLRGGFEAEYLALPEEVLVTVMRDHQKYFAVEDAAGKLMPHFLTVLNIDTDERTAAIIRQGNERVLRARFNDARFFWEFDQRTPLAERVKLLENVTFQKELGSYAAKTERVRGVAAKLAEAVQHAGGHVDAAALDEAARLSKTDLTTELVKEFTELQGEVGGLYARAEGASQTVAEAIYDQYKPAGFEGRLPRSAEGVLLGIADRMDTIAGMFGLGMVPTGSKDPFALRRAANAIVRLLAEGGVRLRLIDAVAAVALDGRLDQSSSQALERFFRERVDTYLREVRGLSYDTAVAVMMVNWADLADVVRRGEAFEAQRTSPRFHSLAQAFKRINNVLMQAEEKGFDVADGVADDVGLEAAERVLTQQVLLYGEQIENLASGQDYVGALEMIGGFVEPLNEFFEQTMVMVDDSAVRARRLGLLSRLRTELLRVGDFSQLVL